MINRAEWRFGIHILLLAVVMIMAGCGAKAPAGESLPGTAAGKTVSWSKMPEMMIDLNHDYTASIRTSMGDFVIKLYADEAPLTVNNFVFLAREGYYDGLSFNRIVENYMVLTEEPNSKESIGPGYVIPDELNTGFKYEKGIIAMANKGTPNSGGGQFFICTGDKALNLNQDAIYSIFGKVISGMDTVQAIADAPVKNNTPIERIIIESIVINEL